jgi:hypothetical protein
MQNMENEKYVKYAKKIYAKACKTNVQQNMQNHSQDM